MQKFFHPKKGILTESGKKFSPLKGVVPLYADEKGQKHELDGSEVPMEHILKEHKKKQQQKQELEQEQKTQEAQDEMEFEQNLSEQDRIEAQEERELRVGYEIATEVKNASERIVEAVKAIPETVIPEIKIPDHYKEQSVWQDEVLTVLKREIPEADYSSIVDAVKSIKFPEIPTPINYMEVLLAIKKSLPKETDFSPLIEAIQNIHIPEYEQPPFKFNKETGRLKVEVDMVSAGGGGNVDTSKLATEETLQALVTASGGSVYNYIQSDKTGGTYYYFGYASSTGWQIKRKELSTGIWMVSRGTGDYTTAFTNRATQTYSLT